MVKAVNREFLVASSRRHGSRQPERAPLITAHHSSKLTNLFTQHLHNMYIHREFFSSCILQDNSFSRCLEFHAAFHSLAGVPARFGSGNEQAAQ